MYIYIITAIFPSLINKVPYIVILPCRSIKKGRVSEIYHKVKETKLVKLISVFSRYVISFFLTISFLGNWANFLDPI